MRPTEGAIERGQHRAYLRPVFVARLFRLLAILTLAFAPLAAARATPHGAAGVEAAGAANHEMAGHEMSTDSQMSAHDEVATMADCEDMSGNADDEPCCSGDCMVACATVPAITPPPSGLTPQSLALALVQEPGLFPAPHGIVPEAAIPPPRDLPRI